MGFADLVGASITGFCCPLCLRRLPSLCATEAHAPARRVGGRRAAFLCKACNNFLGFAYEASAVAAIESTRLAAQGKPAPIRASLSTPGGPHLFVEASFLETAPDPEVAARLGPRRHHRLDVRHLSPDPDVLARFKAARAGHDGRIEIHLKSPSIPNVRLAYLSWAYIQFFGRLGYGFVFSRPGQLARQALLGSSVKSFGSSLFFSHEHPLGALEPVRVGVLMRAGRTPGSAEGPYLALAVDLGESTCLLPLSGDDGSLYPGIPDLVVADEVDLVVVPFEALFSGPPTDLGRAAGYAAQIPGKRRRVLVAPEPAILATDLANASRPPVATRRASPWPAHPDWPPVPLSVPPEPVTETWRKAAETYLVARGLKLAEAWRASEQDVEAIREIARLDVIAGRHVEDLYELFELGLPSRGQGKSTAGSAGPELARLAELADPAARIVAADFRSAGRGDYVSHSARLIWPSGDVVLGPFYRFRTLQIAIDVTLRGAS